jgi:hypothetical protein
MAHTPPEAQRSGKDRTIKEAPMRRTLLRATAALVLAGGLVGAAASPAFASKPVKRACVGSTFATAEAFPLGQLVRSFSQAPDDRAGLGEGIQGLQAGEIPDSLVANTCN